MNNEKRDHRRPLFPEWLTTEQARQMIGISIPTLRRWLKAGRLPGAERKGGRWRIHHATLSLAIQSGLAPGRPSPGDQPIRGRPAPGRATGQESDPDSMKE
jgi:excisionase family DNA binding protein